MKFEMEWDGRLLFAGPESMAARSGSLARRRWISTHTPVKGLLKWWTYLSKSIEGSVNRRQEFRRGRIHLDDSALKHEPADEGAEQVGGKEREGAG